MQKCMAALSVQHVVGLKFVSVTSLRKVPATYLCYSVMLLNSDRFILTVTNLFLNIYVTTA